MPSLVPHIAFNGNTEEAFSFYQSVFGGQFARVIRFGDLPDNPDFPIRQDEAGKLMNIALSLGGEITLSGNDVPSIMGRVSEREHRSKIAILIENKEEAHRIFGGLSAGGDIEVPFEESPDGTGFGMFRDKFGIEWMINFEPIKSI